MEGSRHCGHSRVTHMPGCLMSTSIAPVARTQNESSTWIGVAGMAWHSRHGVPGMAWHHTSLSQDFGISDNQPAPASASAAHVALLHNNQLLMHEWRCEGVASGMTGTTSMPRAYR